MSKPVLRDGYKFLSGVTYDKKWVSITAAWCEDGIGCVATWAWQPKSKSWKLECYGCTEDHGAEEDADNGEPIPQSPLHPNPPNPQEDIKVIKDEENRVESIEAANVNVKYAFETVNGDHDYQLCLHLGSTRFVLWSDTQIDMYEDCLPEEEPDGGWSGPFSDLVVNRED